MYGGATCSVLPDSSRWEYNLVVGDTPLFKNLARASSVGIHLVVATFVGFGIGYMLDGFFGTRPWLSLIFLFLGIGAGFRDLFAMISKVPDLDDEDGPNGSDGQEGGK